MDETTPGDEAGVDRAALSEIEAGTRRPTRALVRRATAGLGVEARATAEFRPRMPAGYDEARDRAAAARLEALGYPSMTGM